MMQNLTQSIKKTLFRNKFLIVTGILFILLGFITFNNLLLQKQIYLLKSAKPVNNGLETTTKYIPIAWAFTDDKVVIRYNDTVYEENNPGDQGIQLVEWERSHPNTQWQWITKLQFITNEQVTASIFDVKHLPDKSGFVLVTSHTSNHQINPTSGIVYYNVYFIFPDNHQYSGDYPALQFTSEGSKYSSKGYWVPVIESTSSDSKAVAFRLYGCWGCGGHHPEFLLSAISLNSTDYGRSVKNIGFVKEFPSTFNWNLNGMYSYVPYPEECTKLDVGELALNPNLEQDCLNKYPQTLISGKLDF